jgi:hypothetical protein
LASLCQCTVGTIFSRYRKGNAAGLQAKGIENDCGNRAILLAPDKRANRLRQTHVLSRKVQELPCRMPANYALAADLQYFAKKNTAGTLPCGME